MPPDQAATPPEPGGWRAARGEPSLADMFGSVRVAKGGSFWRKLVAFLGPGYLVAVGYMDPGNWATSLAGGSKFGYALLAVALISNIMAIVLQALCARLGVGSGRDLAQACRDAYPKWVSWPLWLLAEIAISATDLAEIIGTAIGLNLLFGIPLEIGVLITAADVFLILALQAIGFRWIEAFVVALLGVIAACFAVQIAMADPDWGQVIRGFAPTVDIVANRDMLYLALGILGATVMPHNLYLHSGLVQTRGYGDSVPEKKEAITLATIDSTVALCLALLINASILILAAATFHKAGKTDVAELDQAHTLLSPMLGSSIAPTLFGIALLCCGLNSTVTATLSGQIVMEGFINIKIAPWLRRLVTRMIAIVPAAIVTIWYGEKGTAQLLILSQVVLSLQLPFAIIPLVMFTASKAKMGTFVAPRWLSVIAAIIAAVVVALNVKLLIDFVTG
ncbi:metal ion (Mn2+/Fe2+) transporter (Nramp) family metal ion transporter [Afipia clevelandensis ATCC 49720]|uniref:Divalent metal cation transporter MntH n=2 Tax=Afipia clevelandensis TaxID=1034 RepID=K8PB68_9BRAD|nr:metal ion (Mn2+/Fe2+) transporter (Nramp) family metal ion transporter [Afipia clevelandensis ATCC 49720]